MYLGDVRLYSHPHIQPIKDLMKRLAVLALLVAPFVLTACGGGSAAAPKLSAAPKSPAFVISVTPKQIAGQLGCGSTFAPDTTDEIFVQAVGTCDFKTYGKTRILTFANDTARDNFVKVAQAAGGQYITGHDYAIEYPGG